MNTLLSKKVGFLVCLLLPVVVQHKTTSHLPVSLFLHMDKTIYQPGETFWFTGYIPNRNNEVIKNQNTLYLMLVDAVIDIPIIMQRFPIQTGIGKGPIERPGSLAEGDGWLMSHTNAPFESIQPVFSQLITMRGLAQASGGKFAYTVFSDRDSIAAGWQTINAFGEVRILVASKTINTLIWISL